MVDIVIMSAAAVYLVMRLNAAMSVVRDATIIYDENL